MFTSIKITFGINALSDIDNPIKPFLDILQKKYQINDRDIMRLEIIKVVTKDHFIEFDNKPGKDFLCVLYSKTALNINEIISKIAAQQGDSFSNKVSAVIGNQMVEPKNIQFSTNNISFTGFSRGKSIVAMMVELEHK